MSGVPPKSEKIPFTVDISRMIELLAAQIYPSPFALLRENVQNAFDAILLRRHLGQDFEGYIGVTIEPNRICVSDNGVGMSRDDLRNHFWRAGSSSKNSSNARAAGVVGTFGIGAMANFGLAEELVVVSESAHTGERTRSTARRSTLSVTEDCIEFQPEPTSGRPGTEVTALIQAGKAVSVEQARAYIVGFVAYLPIRVHVNETLVSGNAIEGAVPRLVEAWSLRDARAVIGGGLKANVELTGAPTGEVRIDLSEIQYGGEALSGRMILRQSASALRTFRSSFGLAVSSVASAYGFGGIADLLFLQPTAGREALTTGSMQMLQRIVTAVDDFVSLRLAERPESNSNNFFVNWVRQRGRFDLCGHLRVRLEPEDSLSLSEVREKSKAASMLLYAGNDQSIIKYASADRHLILVSRGSPRRDCELGYLRKYCKIEEMADEPKILEEKKGVEYSIAESGLAFRIAAILSSDYFLNAEVKFGTISHGLPLLVTRRADPVQIFLNPAGPTTRLLLEVYDREFAAFAHMAKDFVRNQIFPHVSDLVPSATRQGAEAFLKAIQRNREIFEYEASDLENLTSLWKDYLEGKIPMSEASHRAMSLGIRSYQVLDSSVSASVRDVMPDVIDNEAALKQSEDPEERGRLGPTPSIQRMDIKTDRKLLTIPEGEHALKGYRVFLAVTDRIREEKGDFFFQPHRTSVVWGGQKALFIFEHHSGEFGLYYDIQTADVIGGEPGGGAVETCTIVMKNRIFIPLPAAIQANFVPEAGEKKRLEVRCDILHIDKR